MHGFTGYYDIPVCNIYMLLSIYSSKRQTKAKAPGIEEEMPKYETLGQTGTEYYNSMPVKELLKTDDNYIILDKENTYNCIEPEYEETNMDLSDREPDSHTKELPQNRPGPADNTYFILEPENTYLSSKNNTKNAPYSDGSADDANEKDKEATTEDNNYFILEPQESHISRNTTPVNGSNPKSYIVPVQNGTDVEQETHDYFVLEQENLSAITKNGSSKQTTKPNETKMLNTLESTDAHTYFVLEPQNTYSSIDPNNVVLQTLPDNEYNKVDMKSKEATHDSNYDALNAEQPLQDEEDTGEYSHIGPNAATKTYNPEYSHINFNKPADANHKGTVSQYSHLNSSLSDQFNER